MKVQNKEIKQDRDKLKQKGKRPRITAQMKEKSEEAAKRDKNVHRINKFTNDFFVTLRF